LGRAQRRRRGRFGGRSPRLKSYDRRNRKDFLGYRYVRNGLVGDRRRDGDGGRGEGCGCIQSAQATLEPVEAVQDFNDPIRADIRDNSEDRQDDGRRREEQKEQDGKGFQESSPLG
jgi:hypothetical protein